VDPSTLDSAEGRLSLTGWVELSTDTCTERSTLLLGMVMRRERNEVEATQRRGEVQLEICRRCDPTHCKMERVCKLIAVSR
jgi:hypothetical protein